jgi:uncharacterized alkaline shock family protein YloU
MTQAEAMERPRQTPGPATTPGRAQTNTASTLVTDQGRTSIASGVVSKIAGIAASEIDGVYQLVGGGAGAAFSTLAQRMTGTEARDRGVNVEVGQREAAVDLNIITVYGASIPEVSQAVRQNIINRVRDMVGLVVKEVNINVVDLYFPGEERPQPQPQEQAQPARRVE